MEPVDIVDIYNKVIGQTTKEEAHQKGLLHKTVISEVLDTKSRWLLVKQALHKQDFGQFVSPVGGHILAGEHDAMALQREAFEELGITNFKHRFIGKAIFNRPVGKHTENHYFIVFEIYSDQTPILNDESVDFSYFTKEELKQRLKQTPADFGDAFIFVVKTFYPEMI